MQAMILAAGLGTRMLPLTAKIPKPLVKLKNKYLIEYVFANLVAAGITEVVINVHHLSHKIKSCLQNGATWGVNIAYSEEKELLDTGGGIVNAINQNLLGSEPFIIISGDLVTDFDLTNLHKKLRHLAHLVLVPNPIFNPEGDFNLNIDGIITPKQFGKDNYTYGNIGIFDPKLFIKPPAKIFPLVQLLKPNIINHKITGEIYYGTWHNIGSLHDLNMHNGI